MTTNKSFESIVKRSFVEANNILKDKDSIFYVLDIDKYPVEFMKKELLSIMHMCSRYNKSE